ncbi:unnamed protein product [Cylicocyclus nassatus]|uniref:SCP domain-containing protein n=1 Tax=Cylicocyclus nassatus TaxID=53992 RepID=A0AA36H3F8_CYLNA|nr:unnamed protein product [Cylicocyclus nassatus]
MPDRHATASVHSTIAGIIFEFVKIVRVRDIHIYHFKAAIAPFALAKQCTYADQSAGLAEDNQTAVLKAVNDARQKLANGIQTNGKIDADTDGPPLPPGQIDALTWSCSLEEAAKVILTADCSTAEHMPPTGNTGLFNYGYGSGEGYEMYYLIGDDAVLDQWLKQIESFGLKNDFIGEEDVKFDGTTGLAQYANLMREDITEIGCVESVCKNDDGDDLTLVYCLTDNERKATSAAPTPQSPAEFPPATSGPNERCPQNTGMHDTLRTKFLDMHNYRRAELAKGNVAKRNGNYLPQSSDMQRMRYNCALEKEVIDYVSTCPSSKSAESTRPDVGENFIRVPQEGLATYLLAAQKAVTSWWKVIRSEEGPGMQVYFRQKHVGTPIESFTQMGWSTSRKLGCAVAKCGSDYVAVCRYSPRGNYVEQVIYKKGTPCTGCAPGSWCTEDALCTLE